MITRLTPLLPLDALLISDVFHYGDRATKTTVVSILLVLWSYCPINKTRKTARPRTTILPTHLVASY